MGSSTAAAQHTTGQWTGQAQTKILPQMLGMSSAPLCGHFLSQNTTQQKYLLNLKISYMLHFSLE